MDKNVSKFCGDGVEADAKKPCGRIKALNEQKLQHLKDSKHSPLDNTTRKDDRRTVTMN